MRVDEVSSNEGVLLVALLAIVAQLPEDLREYTPAIGALGEYFSAYRRTGGHKRGDHNPSNKSIAKKPSIRVTPRWKDLRT